MRTYTKNEFEIESERIDSQIRGHQIRGKGFDLEVAKHNADAKFHYARAASIRVRIAQLEPRIEGQKLAQKQLQLQLEQTTTQRAQNRLGMAQDDLRGELAERKFGQQRWMQKLRQAAMDLEKGELALKHQEVLARLQGSVE